MFLQLMTKRQVNLSLLGQIILAMQTILLHQIMVKMLVYTLILEMEVELLGSTLQEQQQFVLVQPMFLVMVSEI